MMNNYDERQILIKGKIFMHSYYILIALLFINAFLNSFDIMWADGFHSSIIIAMLSLVISSSEGIIKDVFFIKPKERFAFFVLPALGIYLLVLNIAHINDGDKIIAAGTVTRTGCSIITSVLLIIMGVIAGIKFARDKLSNNGEE